MDFNRKKPYLMGIVNVTPDSFYDGNKHLSLDAALSHIEGLINNGADIVDIGAESSRPGALPLTVEEELARLEPVLTAYTSRFDTPLSVDTRHVATAKMALEMGATLINDIDSLDNDAMIALIKNYTCWYVLMHRQGDSQTMQENPHYDNVVHNVIDSLKTRLADLGDKIIIDAGIGFGKTVRHNTALLKHTQQLCGLGRPVMISTSNKSFIGQITGAEVSERLAGTLASALSCYQAGARLFRVHDVAAHKQAFDVWEAIERA